MRQTRDRCRPGRGSAALAAFVLALAAGEPSAAAERRRAPTRTTLDLRLAQPREADKLEALLPDPALTRPPRKAVTDLVLVASATGGDIEAALAAPNSTPPPLRLFALRLLAVVGGRIEGRATALCGGWSDDRSQCRVSCDGGRFDLVRQLTAESPSFRLRIDGDSTRDGILVSSCDRDDGPEVRLVPKPGQARSDIVLRAD